MIHHAKGHQKSAVKLSKGAKEALDDYLKIRLDDNPYLFISSKQTTSRGHLSRTFFMGMFKKLLKHCGLEDTMITPHALRHSAAYFNLLRGGTLEETRQLLRHQDLQSTLVYQNYLLRLNDDQEEKIDAFILKEEGLDLLIILE